MLNRARRRWRSMQPAARRSVVLLGVCLAGWPLSAVATALDVVPGVFEQVMLALSWGAPAYTAANMILTASMEDNDDSSCEHCPRESQGR